MHILIARWTEPCEGSVAYTVALTDGEAIRLQSVLDWLEEHAGQDYGHTLMEWELHPSRSKGEADLESFDAVLNEVALQSRYNECDEPGEFYGGRHSDLDGRPG